MDEYTVLIMGIFRITQINSVCVSSLVEMMILKNSRKSRNSQRWQVTGDRSPSEVTKMWRKWYRLAPCLKIWRWRLGVTANTSPFFCGWWRCHDITKSWSLVYRGNHPKFALFQVWWIISRPLYIGHEKMKREQERQVYGNTISNQDWNEHVTHEFDGYIIYVGCNVYW